MSDVDVIGSFCYELHQMFMDKVTEATNGRVTFKYYPAGTLYGGVAVFDAVSSGAVDMGDVGYLIIWRGVAEFQILNIPGVFQSGDHYLRFVKDPAGDQALKKYTDPINIKTVGLFPTLNYTFWMTRDRELKDWRDAKGLRSWGGSGTFHEAIEEWSGHKPVSIPWAETHVAFIQGILDMMIDGSASVTPRKWDESASHAFAYFFPSTAVMAANLDFWNSLPADIQQAMEGVEPEMIDISYEMTLKDIEETIAYSKTKFKTLNVATEEQMAEFAAQIMPPYQAGGFLKEVPPEVLETINRLAKPQT